MGGISPLASIRLQWCGLTYICVAEPADSLLAGGILSVLTGRVAVVVVDGGGELRVKDERN